VLSDSLLNINLRIKKKKTDRTTPFDSFYFESLKIDFTEKYKENWGREKERTTEKRRVGKCSGLGDRIKTKKREFCAC